MTRVVGYIRVSTEEQADSGVSLKAQRAKLVAYASLYELELVDVVEDGGESARTLKRPGIARVLAMLTTGEVDGVLVAKLDRLTRSVADMAQLIADHFSERAGKQLLSVADQIDTRTAAGRLVLNILTSVGQWERETIAERTTDALAHKRRDQIVYSPTPLGYRRVGDRLERDAVGEATMARIRELRAAGTSLRGIARVLADEGRPTSRGGAWSPMTVKYLLERKANEMGRGEGEAA